MREESTKVRFKTRAHDRYENFENDPLSFNNKKCPICGKYAAVKYYNETKRVYVYSHPRKYAAALVCEALR